MEQTLLLNATYEPLTVIDWQRAMTLHYKGRVEILATHDRMGRAVSFFFPLPSVVRLLRFVKVRRGPVVPFTRANIYARDRYVCQYCHRSYKVEQLNLDHVIPVSQGGTRTWENIVTACLTCNVRKGGRTPDEAGMPLKHTPMRPVIAPTLKITIGMKNTPESWRDFLYWNAELEG